MTTKKTTTKTQFKAAKNKATAKKPVAEKAAAAAPTITRGFKGFDKDLKCRDMQFEVGKTFTVDCAPKLCESGLHFCEYPLDVFGYYPPASSRFCAVETDCASPEKHGDDSKRVTTSLSIGLELDLPGIIKAAIDFTMSRAKPADGSTNSGYQGAATTTGKDSCAFSGGHDSKVRGSLGCAICCVERDPEQDHKIVAVKSAIVDGTNIKADTWYTVHCGEWAEVGA